MNKVTIRLSNDEFDTIKSCFSQQSEFAYVFLSENLLYQNDNVEIYISFEQLDSFMEGLIEALRAKGTINIVYVNFGCKIDSLIDKLTNEFYG